MEAGRRERAIAVHAPRRALARGALAALERLGYRVLDAPFERSRDADAPAARIAGPRELRRLPHDGTPIVLVARGCARGARERHDERVVARLRRPAPVVELYRALQLALEKNPRRVPRASITLPARCVNGEGDWPGAIVSLSEGGCLVRSNRPLASRRRLRLWFPLPEKGLVEVTARPVYERRGHLGLAFLDVAEATRRAIAACVEEALVAR
jgi:hypothetical protein